MTSVFIWDLVTPRRPHGDDVRVVFDNHRREVLSATNEADGSPVRGRSLQILRGDLEERLDLSDSWEQFLKRENVRLLN